MESLGCFTLSYILSFLSEIEGVSLLITKKSYAHKYLPLFRRPDKLSTDHVKMKRYRFVVAPVQDSNVLLDRLNTCRLQKRSTRIIPGLSTVEIARAEWACALRNNTSSNSIVPPHLELLRFPDRHCGDEKLMQEGSTLLVSYPRSGNSLVRSLLEKTTGVVTGSDTRPDRSLSIELAKQHGLVGEGKTKSIFVKTHWPERIGNQIFESKRAILLVRNPYDAIDSYWNMNATKSHTRSLAPLVYSTYDAKFQALVKNEILVWIRFLDYWLSECPIPVLIVRFEDLIRDPANELSRMLSFSFQTRNLTTFWNRRIEKVAVGNGAAIEGLGSYQPRGSTKGVQSIGKSIHNSRFSQVLLDYIERACENRPSNYLKRFGYSIAHQNFPSNFSSSEPHAMSTTKMDTRGTKTASIAVNQGMPVRSPDCEFGRRMQKWRHSVTNNDTAPLPTTAIL